MKVTVRYFASMRDFAACASENVETEAATPADLYRELQIRHGFPHQPGELAVALDDELARWDASLPDGCEVSLLPPVSGG